MRQSYASLHDEHITFDGNFWFLVHVLDNVYIFIFRKCSLFLNEGILT